MGEVLVADKNIADTLSQQGFKYHTSTVDDMEMYIFVQTREIMKALNDLSLNKNNKVAINKYMCF